MRPNSYISPDGPSNFYQAVAAAASPSSKNRGGLIAFNDRYVSGVPGISFTFREDKRLIRANYSITSIYYSTKVNANTPDTFRSIEQGNLGAFLAGQPYYFFGPSYPTGRPYFDVRNVTELPSVIIVYGHRT